ncbi:HAD ATPase, P-type, family IC [Vavraia culicis subsp. floridensis]|uniref:HAD ATPase, P-type, family IC n=1 Tax=Vavraia culicis (isolate floridensis) TaxID=948595 RepID=L2GWD8_VAVCU|nr:HAD ATPase, P-type, family IC [Vavraia culicis subsp. floridensis]ELA47395.1 HAD ATPase, P-type, family IC [Vavraia culicis subsp. floridensis]
MKRYCKVILETVIRPFEDKLSVFLLLLQVVSVFMVDSSIFDFFMTLLLLYLNSCLETLQNYRNNREISKFNSFMKIKTKKLDFNKLVLTEEIGVGDIIHLSIGDKIPSDCILIDQSTFKATKFLKVNESILTGESIGVIKKQSKVTLEDAFLFYDFCWKNSDVNNGVLERDSELRAILEEYDEKRRKKLFKTLRRIRRYKKQKKRVFYGGTFVLQGTSLALVIDKSREVLKIQTSLTNITSELTSEVQRIQHILFISILSVCIVLFIYCMLVGNMSTLKVCTSLAVTAIPEGLDLVVRINLSVIVFKLKKNMIFIKKLVSLEILGSVNMIVLDKTGTITTNEQMIDQIIEVWPIKRIFSVDSKEKGSNDGNPTGQNNNDRVQGTNFEFKPVCISENEIFMAICKHLSEVITVDDKKMGDPLDISMFEAVPDCKSKLLFFKTFCCENMVTRGIIELGNNYYEILKGAPENVLALCHSYNSDSKKSAKIKSSDKKCILSNLKERSIACAYKRLNKRYITKLVRNVTDVSSGLEDKQLKKKNYKLLGFITFKDTLREGVKDCFKWCQANDVKIRILTGDSKLTTMNLLNGIGIQGEFCSAKKYIDRNLSNANFEDDGAVELSNTVTATNLSSAGRHVNKNRHEEKFFEVIYRASPSNKHTVLKHLGKSNRILMTGDGVNDLLAIKQADVGVSLGEGSDLSKEVSDIILIDSDIKNILILLGSGRVALHNVKALLKYLISSNIGEVIAVFLAIVTNKAILNSKQLLFINLLTDGLPATLMCMNRGHGKGRFLFFRTTLIAAYLGFTTYLIQDKTKSFLFIVIGEMLNSLNNINLGVSLLVSCRQNPHLVLAVFLTLALLFAITNINIFSWILNVEKITLREFLNLMLLAFPIILIDEVFKQFS